MGENCDRSPAQGSPDGTLLAFTTLDALMVLDTRTGIATPIVAAPRLQIGTLEWSPKGRQIAFSASLRPVGD